MDAYEPQQLEELAPNMNNWTGAGRISKIEPLTGKTPGLAFTVDYRKVWPNGGKDLWPIRCYVSGRIVLNSSNGCRSMTWWSSQAR